MKVRDQITRIMRTVPHATRHGRLYRAKADLRIQSTRIRLFTLFKSNEGDWLMRAHVFKSSSISTDAAWHEKLSELLTDESDSVQNKVIAGITTRTGGDKFWSVAKYIGWVPDAVHKSARSNKSRSRSKKTHKGRAHG